MTIFAKAGCLRPSILALLCTFGPAPAALAEADIAGAEAIIAEHSQLPTFAPPGSAFDAKTCMAGKKILTIPSSSSIPFAAGITAAMADAAEELGFEVRVWQNQGQPSQYVQGFDYAIQNGYDGIELAAGIVPAGLAPQIAAAKAAGVRVYASHYTDVTLDHDPSVDVSLPISFSRVGEILAAWVVKQTGGDANVLVIGSDDLLPSQPYWKAFEAKLTELCPDCSARYTSVTVPDWATRIQTTAQSTLLQDPSINYIVPLYDSMSQFVLPALAITGKRGQIPIASFNGTPFIIDMIQDGDVEMDVGESLGWIGRSSLDAYMRDLCQIGDVPTELYVPFLIFDASNAETAGSPADFDRGYGDAHVSGYRTPLGAGMTGDGLPRRVPGEAPALLARGVSKVFGTSRVLDDVSLSVMPGEVHGLLGANGSGKSTLIKIIAGLHAPEKGAELILHGTGVPFPMPPGGARRHGIAFVHQHLALMPSLSVLENMMLNDLASGNSWRIDWGAARRHVRAVLDTFGIPIDPDARVADLGQSDRALIAITRAFEDLRANAPDGRGILILDEPTPFLPKAGVDKLFGLIRAVKAKGVSVILVAHDIDEIREITDRATILRDGRIAGTVVSAEADRDRFMRLIMGEKVVLFQGNRILPPGKPVAARIERLGGDVSFDIREGEILGLTGLMGSGFDRVPEALFGAARTREGTVTLADAPQPLAQMTPAKAMAQGMVFLPADRLGRAGAGSLSIADNMSLPVLAQFRGALGIDWAGIHAHCIELGRRYDVRPNRPDLRLSSLSGGNAQKVLMAKWLQTNPRLLMLDEPTQGVDVGARQKLFQALDAAAHAGTAILIASTDPEQLAQLCHRVLIFAKGCIVAELVGAQITKDAISAQTLAAHPGTGATKEAAA